MWVYWSTHFEKYQEDDEDTDIDDQRLHEGRRIDIPIVIIRRVQSSREH